VYNLKRSRYHIEAEVRNEERLAQYLPILSLNNARDHLPAGAMTKTNRRMHSR